MKIHEVYQGVQLLVSCDSHNTKSMIANARGMFVDLNLSQDRPLLVLNGVVAIKGLING